MSEPGTPPPAGTPLPAAQPTWRDSLPDDLKGEASLSTIPDVPTLAKNYLATKAMTGRKAYDLPSQDWKPEQWKEWNKSIGVPETPDKYSPVDKAVLEKAGLPPELMTAALAKAHELGLTDRQVKGLIGDWYVGETAKGRTMQTEAEQKARVEGEAELRKEFGDKYDAKMGLLKAWLKTNDPESKFATKAFEKGFANDPDLVRTILNSAEKTLEDSSITGRKSPFGVDSDSASANAEIVAMVAMRKADPAYNKKFEDPKSTERQRWDLLHKLASPSKAA